MSQQHLGQQTQAIPTAQETARPRGAFIERILERGVWGATPLSLVDVGCSGGIDPRWQVFGDRLRAVGFDPLETEIARLNADNTRPGVRYEAAFVTCRDYDRICPREFRSDPVASKNDDPFARTSTALAHRQLATSYVQEEFNAGQPVVLSDRIVVLDEWFAREERPQVDFLKIDTDGHDIEVLLGARDLLSDGGALGVLVEAPFQGVSHDFANRFSNIDHLLREQGFSLFDLSAYRYSRQQLPAPFLFELAAQTTSGQVLWGDALYFRDLGAPAYDRMWPYQITPERIIKLACLFDVFDLGDCAAELLETRGLFLGDEDRVTLLDLLAGGEPGAHARRRDAFTRDFTSLYPSRVARESVTVKQLSRLRDRMAKLHARNEELRERLRRRDEKIAQLTTRLDRTDPRP